MPRFLALMILSTVMLPNLPTPSTLTSTTSRWKMVRMGTGIGTKEHIHKLKRLKEGKGVNCYGQFTEVPEALTLSVHEHPDSAVKWYDPWVRPIKPSQYSVVIASTTIKGTEVLCVCTFIPCKWERESSRLGRPAGTETLWNTLGQKVLCHQEVS